MLQVLTEIYYPIGILALYIEMQSVMRPHYVLAKVETVKLLVRTKTVLTPRAFLFLVTEGFVYPVWTVLGLLTVQAPLFFTLLAMSLVKRKLAWWYRIDGIFSVAIILLILINHYYLKINLNQLVLQRF